ncbi:uncharacterized protein [Procambarus clarkii]|uniref:uncharacterized protein n=1 Tax=Procambarus clarkii TaxID=6728 RepID=UPI001E670FBE|nr:uncharacterized protein LOC123770499 [Procambarus clarkii]
MRMSGSPPLSLATTANRPEDTQTTSTSIRGSSTSNRGGNSTNQTSGANVAMIHGTSSDRPPPAYPCKDVCVQCGMISDVTDDDTVTNCQQGPNSVSGCQCECHKQTRCEKRLDSDHVSHIHIPPAGPHCQPGCGYSGLPCYNCSLLQNHLQPQAAIAEPLPSPPQSGAHTFSPQIYTIELLENSSTRTLSSPSTSQVIEHQQIVTESDRSQETTRRKMCFSIVVFIIAINVFIGVFRMLVGAVGTD